MVLPQTVPNLMSAVSLALKKGHRSPLLGIAGFGSLRKGYYQCRSTAGEIHARSLDNPDH